MLGKDLKIIETSKTYWMRYFQFLRSLWGKNKKTLGP